jgi:DNA invertase Pin-like site-specific DNA recombinase
MTMRVGLYTRVSTDQGQTTENQERELRAVAERHGWQIVEVFADQGVSGAKRRDERPAMLRLMQAVARRKIDLVAAWSVCRLGRSLPDLIGFLAELRAKHVDLYLHQQGLDTCTPAGEAMFQMMGVFSQFERAMIVERVRSGMARAREKGTRSGKPIGRPPVSEATKAKVLRLRAEGYGIKKIAREVGCGVGTVLKIVGASQPPMASSRMEATS